MAEDKKSETESELMSEIKEILSSEMKYSDRYGIQYLENETFIKISDVLSKMRRLKMLVGDEYHTIFEIYKSYYKNGIKYKNLLANEPRYIAQKFIGKKEVRKFIFERDKACLRCGSSDYLSIDHIIPVNKNGLNEIDNLQTLCRSCNSWKSDRIIDFRIKIN